MQTKTISRKKSVDVVFSTHGKFFTCVFIKKTDGQERTINCRLGVTKHLHGGTLPYNPTPLGLLPVFDLQKRDYRMINFKTMKSVIFNQIKYIIK